MRLTAAILSILVAASWADAQEAAGKDITAANAAATIVDVINEADGTIYIYQPSSIDRLLQRSESGNALSTASQAKSNVGYRIQVFLDNNMRTAKANAEYRMRLMEQSHPEWRAYITFDSPYWRVRIGDFRTRTEADAAMRELKNTYPAFADDLRLVRERINVGSTNN